jgi:tryptophan-rich sensory protein
MMNTTMVRTLAYPPLLTRARRALAALVIGALVALAAGCTLVAA